MKKRMKWVAMAGAAVLALSLTACGSISLNLGSEKSRMEGYVQGYLDLTYLGKLNKDYQTEMELSEEEAQQQYEEGIQVEVEFFESGIGLIDYPTEEITQRLTQLYKEIYSHSDYTVGAATKLDSGNYAVEVTVRPIDLMTKVTSDDFEKIFEQILADRGITTQEQLDAQFQAMDEQYAMALMDEVERLIPELTYGTDQVVMLQLKEEDGYYSLVDSGLQKLDEIMIDYYGAYV